MKAQAFIDILAPLAVANQKKTGVLASITIAQGALESAWGASAPGNNLFGIKGSGQLQETREFINGHWLSVVDGFRVYDDWIGSVIDHSQFLIENGRYARAGFFDRCAELDYAGAAKALQAAGYATDPNYASKLITIIESNNLHPYDILEDEEEMPMLDQGVAQTLINTFLKPSWVVANEQLQATQDAGKAAAWKEQRDYYGWLADNLRDASGLPRE